MICDNCKRAKDDETSTEQVENWHERCEGKDRCYCQHKTDWEFRSIDGQVLD